MPSMLRLILAVAALTGAFGAESTNYSADLAGPGSPENTSTAQPEPDFDCTGLPYGFTCKEPCTGVFYSCDGGETLELRCPSILVFDPNYRACIFPDHCLKQRCQQQVDDDTKPAVTVVTNNPTHPSDQDVHQDCCLPGPFLHLPSINETCSAYVDQLTQTENCTCDILDFLCADPTLTEQQLDCAAEHDLVKKEGIEVRVSDMCLDKTNYEFCHKNESCVTAGAPSPIICRYALTLMECMQNELQICGHWLRTYFLKSALLEIESEFGIAYEYEECLDVKRYVDDRVRNFIFCKEHPNKCDALKIED